MTSTRPWATLAVALGLSTIAFACGGAERSPEAYCRAFYETAAPMRDDYVAAGEEVEEDPLGAIITVLGAPGDMVVVFDAMANHAPDEIRPDTEAARDAMKEQQSSLGDAFSDPLGALGGGLIAGLTSSGSFSRVDDYLNQHCPPDSDLAQSVIAERR